jgi:uncharacterized protein (DUF2267 family)
MKFRQLIKKVQVKSGFSDEESMDALECLVESLSVHLDDGDRKEFAMELPMELQDIALSVYPTSYTSRQDIVEQFMELQHIGEEHARKQVLFSWEAIKELVSEGLIAHIRVQLPLNTLILLQ